MKLTQEPHLSAVFCTFHNISLADMGVAHLKSK